MRGVATFATPADVAAWAGDARALPAAVMASGAVDRQVALEDPETLAKGVYAFDPLASVALIPPRRILVVHGAEDRLVPVEAARELVAAAQGRAELRDHPGCGALAPFRPEDGRDAHRLARPEPLSQGSAARPRRR